MFGIPAGTAVRPADFERLMLLRAEAAAEELPRRVAYNVTTALVMGALLVPIVPLGRLVIWAGALSLLWGASALARRIWASSLQNRGAARSFVASLTAVNAGMGIVWGAVLALPAPEPGLSDHRVATLAVLATVSIGSALRFLSLPRVWLVEVAATWIVAAAALLGANEPRGPALICGGLLFAVFVALQARRLRDLSLDAFRLRLRNEGLVSELLGEQDHTREAWDRVREQHAALDTVRRQLVTAASHDDLTGVYNRRHLMAQLESAVAALKAGGNHFALVFVGVEDFDALTDRHGPQAGELALLAVARALRTTTRETDALGRLGGHEFAILVRGVAEAEVAAIGDRVTLACRSAHVAGEADMILRVAVGIATSRASQHVPDLLRIADRMMRKARKADPGAAAVYVADAPLEGSLVS